MRVLKLLFIVIFPLIILLAIIQRANSNNVSLRSTYEYAKNAFTLVATEYKDDLRDTLNVFNNFKWALPNVDSLEANNFLQQIWAYVKWFWNCFIQVNQSIILFAKTMFNTIVLVLRIIYYFVRVLFYGFGF